jgi:hypothetical protein
MERVYCLTRCSDGGWLLLNRAYKPWMAWASWRGLWADYEACIGTRVALTEAQIRILANGYTTYTPGDEKVWLYADATRPEKGGTHLAAYEARLALLGQFGEIDWMVAA